MKNFRLTLSLPFLAIALIATSIVLLMGVPAIIIGAEPAKKIFKGILDMIYE